MSIEHGPKAVSAGNEGKVEHVKRILEKQCAGLPRRTVTVGPSTMRHMDTAVI